MAENGHENIVGFEEERMAWFLSSNVPNEACMLEKDQFQRRNQKHHQPKRHYSKSMGAEPLHDSNWRSSQLRPQRKRNGTNTNWAIGGGGPGMQALFLDSGQRSCGTGVFLPRGAGTHLQSYDRPACPSVLLPPRVVQALNLNVHELGWQIKPQQECSSKQAKSGGVDCKSFTSKKDYIDASEDKCCSTEIFLPHEWTY